MKKIYSPIQIGIGSLLGGPMASTYFLQKNFTQLGKDNSSKITVIIGIILVILLPIYVWLVKISNPIIFVPFVFLSMVIADKLQLSTLSIKNSDFYTQESYFKLIFLSILILIMTFFIGFIIIFLYPKGFINWFHI